MSKLKKYPSYKDSGVEWLGEIPEGWKIQKMKYLGQIFAGLTDKKSDDFSKEFSEQKEAFIPFTNICNNFKIDKNQMQYVKIKPFEKQNKVQKNDIIFLMSSETLDDIGKCSIHLDEEKFYLNSFCKGFRVNNSKVNAEFLNYLLQSKTYRNYFALVGRGFTRINIKQEYIKDLFTVLPNNAEQIKIASFLDEKTDQLDKVIQQKEQLIKLLKERRQILINDAVTKGLDKTVAMKDSGVEWIGEIPEGWKVKKLKYIFTEINIRSTTGNEELLSLSKYKGVIPKSSLAERAGMAQSLIGYKKVFKNTLVINKMQAVNGLLSVSKLEGITSPDYSIYKVINNNFNIDYYGYLLNQTVYLSEFKKVVTGVMEGFIRLYSDDLYNILTYVPPTQEQQKIVKYIEKNNQKIDKAINLQQQQITKLKEYKTTLIDSVVTGKVRVKDD